MRRQGGPPIRVRAAASGMALVADALALLLLMMEERALRAEPSRQRIVISIWPDRPPELPEPAQPRSQPSPGLPSPTTRPGITPDPLADGPAPPPAPGAPAIDWQAEAAAVAADQAARPAESGAFSPAPTTVRKPCKPPDSSFEWNPEQPRAGLLPWPYVRIGESCIVALGFFSCTFGGPGPNTHLFDDMQAGKTQDSSVPDPNYCD